MSENVKVTSVGVKKLLKNYDRKQSIAEYIWNGFDAGSDVVSVEYKTSFGELGAVTELVVCDRGSGIAYENLNAKFEPFFQSDKAIEIYHPRNQSACHGKNGVGRLTFHTFAKTAAWNTTYRDGQLYRSYRITIRDDSLNSFDPGLPGRVEATNTGTIVHFSGIYNLSEDCMRNEIIPFLCAEFGWFLELNKEKQFKLLVNGEPLDYAELIEDQDRVSLVYAETKQEFDVRFIRWARKLNDEYSKFYFLDSIGNERWKENTTFNNKGDDFFHSIYVKSAFFDQFQGGKNDKKDEAQGELFASRKDEAFKFISSELDKYLNRKRVPFIRQYTERLIQSYEKEDVLPKFDPSPVAQYQKHVLEETVRELYLVQPKIFTSLNHSQKKAFVELLNAMLELGADDRLLEIISKIVEMTPEQRNEFAHILEYANISAITKTIGMIKDRFKTVEQLKQLVFTPALGANERDHLQKLIERHYWLFGEQYNLVTAEEQKFEEALRRYTYLLRGDGSSRKIKHLDKNKEMDVFTCRKDVRNDEVENIIVELKHPNIKLGRKELNQVDTYLGVILEQPEFNAGNMHWTVFLVGNDFDTSGSVERALESAASNGEKFLVQKTKNSKVYVKKWSEVFAEFECRHKFILEKLELDKEYLVKNFEEQKTAAQIVSDARMNDAAENATWENPRPALGSEDVVNEPANV